MKKMKSLLSVICALLLVATMVSPVFAKLGSDDMPWLKSQSLLDKILERDGFVDGIWYPWINGSTSGHNLSGNEVMAMHVNPKNAEEWSRVEMDYYGADKMYQEIYNLKAMGYNMMAWGGSIYAEGVKLDVNTGDVLGIKEDYLANARRLLDMCREIGMPVVWNVYFHSSSAPNYYGIDCWNIVARMACDKTVADHYAQRFVAPLCEMLAEYPDVIAMVSIADEPENEINDAEVGDQFDNSRAMYGTTRENMFYLLSAINKVVKEKLPNVARTVASNNKNKALYADFALDLMGHNNYSNQAHVPTTESYKSNRPVILTEYNVGGDGKENDESLTKMLIQFRQNMVKEGYKGGLQWCWMPNRLASQTSYYLLNSYDTTDFRATVTDLRHYIDEYRAEYQGKTITVDAAVLYANDGTGLVEWIPSKRGVKMDLLRSTDGGTTWTKVLDNVDQASYVNNKKKGSYKDTKIANSMYKIVVRDASGKSAESTPNNVAGADQKHKKTMATPQVPSQTGLSYIKPNFDKTRKDRAKLLSFGEVNNRPLTASANLISNPSFESTGGQWASMVGSTVSVVADTTAPDGGKSLYFNTTGVATGDYNTKFTVKVQKNTDYVFSTWIKGDFLSAGNKGHASIGVIDPDTGKYMVYWEYYRDAVRTSREDQQIYPTAWDNEWHLRSVSFNSGNKSEVTIALYGYGSKMWLDDMALYKNGEGKKYVGENMSSSLQMNLYSPMYTCTDDKCINKNPSVSNADHWNTGTGWDAGFMSVADGGKSGKALKYSANSAVGLYYIKWVDVTPNTDYVFSVDAKILKSGGGRLALLNDRLTLPEEAVFLEFDSSFYGTDWFKYLVAFNSSGFDKVGIAVCDLGGQALLDNIQLFKKADGTPVADSDGDDTDDNDGGNTVTGSTTANANSDKTTANQGGATTQVAGSTDDVVDGEDTDTPEVNVDVPGVDGEDTVTDTEQGQDGGATTLSGPILLLISFGGTALLVAAGIGIYFLVVWLKKKKAAVPAEAVPEVAPVADAPVDESVAETADAPVDETAE